MYSTELLDHFEHPRNTGEVSNADACVQLENPACGDVLKLSIKVIDDQVVEARFMAKGCVPAMGCGSLITELIQGKTLQEAQQVRREDLIAAIGGLPEASQHASHLALDALAAALKQIRK
jgi:nitrogen fixation protein NifU and related proteins